MSTLSAPIAAKVRTAAIIGFLIALPLLSCAEAPRYTRLSAKVDTGKHAGNKATSYYQTGMATYYGNKFHGRKTASGERYDRNKMTAAHKTLPFGTVVRVTCMSNGKTVTVRVNDRGPLKGGRIIDLSFAAAKAIDMISAGVVRVGIDIVEE